MSETSQEKFRRVAPKRVQRLLREIRLIGNLGNRNHYDYKQDEVDKIFNAIEGELQVAKSRFAIRRTDTFRL